MKIEGFGNKKIYINYIEGTTDLLIISFLHNFKKYYGVCDRLTGKTVADFTIDPITTAFSTNDHLDYCFVKGNESYHVSKRNNENFELVKKFVSNDKIKLELVNTINDNYWFLKIDKTTTTYSLYDVINQKLITPEFDNITFEMGDDKEVLALIEKCLIVYDSENEEDICVGSILAYINNDGKYVTPFYSPDTDSYYDTTSLNGIDNNLIHYKRYIDSIATNLYKNYLKESSRVDEVLEIMYINHYSKDEIMPEPKKCKIIEFKRSDKNET